MPHAEPIEQDAPRFTTLAGEIIGWRDRGVIRATGIRYARAKRFCAPEDEPPATVPIHATEWSPALPQNTIPELDAALGVTPKEAAYCEGELHLSVTVPDSPATKPRPVMVWIHGGSYVFGAADLAVFDVRPLALEQDVIVVAVNYRLGLLGFLGGYADRPANLGLLDLISALRWINTNIAAMGGDPGNVTLFGHSAGGDAAAHLMIAEGTQGLFQRVIIQSAPLGISRGRAKMNARMGQKAAALNDEAPLDEVLRVQEQVVNAAQGFGLRSAMPFGTQYGHYPLPVEAEVDAAWRRAAPNFDVFIGYTAEETALFLVMSPNLMRLRGWPLMGEAATRAMVAATTHKVYKRDALRFARRHTRAGGNAYVYRLEWGKRRYPFGAAHTIELPLLLGEPGSWQYADLVKHVDEATLLEHGKRLRGLWAEFARSGQLLATGQVEPQILKWWKAN
ncbi:carboxylesterase/lipase family protein [Halomonas aquamarina]|uniref:Carboxylesterase/lipase family protein n=1 Tax=Vreelandella aquamarina TaxID=77097 RepID=A0ACC5VWJ2_9GAMM|nr:carboxylesterase family protein [Halomonas aquamarina]MBZ5488074.1 carboxylesterase/lipase family protein [Halomonas aquamarina]